MFTLRLIIGTKIVYCTKLELSCGIFCFETRYWSFEKANKELCLLKVEYDYCEVCRFVCNEFECTIQRSKLFVSESAIEPIIYFTFLPQDLE